MALRKTTEVTTNEVVPNLGSDKAEMPRKPAWRQQSGQASLPEVYASIRVPQGAGWFCRLLAFIGPGYLIAVGYMDPGNWATDLGAGAAYNYSLLYVVVLASLTAVFLQALSAKLGLVTGRDLAQACRDHYSKRTSTLLWISAEIGIVACDLAEVIGSAIALNLLFHLPLVLGVILTGADVLLVLALQHKGFRWIEALVITLIATMAASFAYEVFISRPEWAGVARGLIPTQEIARNPQMLYLALGILGATVMPHNLYLHSSIVQTRKVGKSEREVKESIRMAYADSTIALVLATLVNAALLIVAAAWFFRTGLHKIEGIGQAYHLLIPIVGSSLAVPLFAIALLASGQNSTLTGTLAGQVVLEGFLQFHLDPWLRRMVSRLIAIVPAIAAIWIYGSDKGLNMLMIFSQVVLSAQLSFAIVPLVQFTSDRAKMGVFANGWATRALGWSMAAGIGGLNAYLIVMELVGTPPA